MSAAIAIWMEPPANGLVMSENVKKPLLAACRHLLHPLVRILLRHGVMYGEFSDAVRGAYIDIAKAELIPAGRARTTKAININASPAIIWQWLAQVGQDRAGFYSYTWLENLMGVDIHNADEIHPEWQQLEVGDGWRIVPAD